MSRFYHFSQNNSGGSFDFDEDSGITVHVIIEATDHANANDIAEDAGIYFDGCRDGVDCNCCGDRWYPAWDDGDENPSVYGDELTDEWAPKFSKLAPNGFGEACVHFLDGTKKWYGLESKS